MSKKKGLITATLTGAMLIAACGSEEEAKPAAEAETSTEEIEEVEVEEETAVETSSPTESTGASTAEFDAINAKIAEETEGDLEVFYTNQNPNFVHDMDGFKVQVEEYQIIKLTDMNKDYYIEFHDQTDGYVITSKVTIENTRDIPMYYTPMFHLQLESEYNTLMSGRTFVRDEYPKSTIESEASKWGAGEKVTGFITFTLTNAEFDSLATVKPKFIMEGGAADNNQFKDSFKGKGTFDFPFSDESVQTLANAPSFYPDRLTTGNMADKALIFEDQKINETKNLKDVKVTLEGVQFTEITPTPANKSRFSNFGDSGVVALTVKLTIDNQSTEKINLLNIKSKLIIDKDRGSAFSEGMVEPMDPREIEAGEQGEKYHVFLFRKDEFEIFKNFELQFGPFVKEDGKDQFKGNSVLFTIPK